MIQEASIRQKEANPNEWGRFPWFAYIDPESNEARAVSCSLALIVVRPTLHEATDLLKELATDYIEHTWNPNLKTEDIKRSVPREAWEAHTNRFCEILGDLSGKQGVDWDCGSYIVSSDGTISPS